MFIDKCTGRAGRAFARPAGLNKYWAQLLTELLSAVDMVLSLKAVFQLMESENISRSSIDLL